MAVGYWGYSPWDMVHPTLSDLLTPKLTLF